MLRKLEVLDDAGARWTPEGKLIPLLGIVRRLTGVEWRWIDGASAEHRSIASKMNFGRVPI